MTEENESYRDESEIVDDESFEALEPEGVTFSCPPMTYESLVMITPYGITHVREVIPARPISARVLLSRSLQAAFRRYQTPAHLDRMIEDCLVSARQRTDLHLRWVEAQEEVHHLVMSLAMAGRRPEWGRVALISSRLLAVGLDREARGRAHPSDEVSK